MKNSKLEAGKPWARMRIHGPCMIFEWFKTEKEAWDSIEKCVLKDGEQVRSFMTVAFFPSAAGADAPPEEVKDATK